ncbi:MAG: hypothetical protein ABSG94_11445 [Brevinematales bacterium]
MDYTFFAIACYIVMRAFRQIFEEYREKTWFKIIYKIIAVATCYAGLAAILVWFFQIRLLGFDFKS